LSVELDLLKELQDLIGDYSPRLRGNIYLCQNNSEIRKPGDEWLRLSTENSYFNNVSISTIDRITTVRIGYYRISSDKANYNHSQQIKDLIISNLPRVNRSYWRYFEIISTLNETDLEEAEQYEGFELVIDFWRSEEAKCSVPTYLTDDDGYRLVSEDGYLITGD
jgi:hypothetical protein